MSAANSTQSGGNRRQRVLSRLAAAAACHNQHCQLLVYTTHDSRQHTHVCVIRAQSGTGVALSLKGTVQTSGSADSAGCQLLCLEYIAFLQWQKPGSAQSSLCSRLLHLHLSVLRRSIPRVCLARHSASMRLYLNLSVICTCPWHTWVLLPLSKSPSRRVHDVPSCRAGAHVRSASCPRGQYQTSSARGTGTCSCVWTASQLQQGAHCNQPRQASCLHPTACRSLETGTLMSSMKRCCQPGPEVHTSQFLQHLRVQ